MKSKMFDFVTVTKNPLGGECYNCTYCFMHGSKGLKNRFPRLKEKYNGEMRLFEKVFYQKFPKDTKLCFFCDCIDWMHYEVTDKMIYRIIGWINVHPNIMFLSLTKNPDRYFDFKQDIPINVILGSTIESDIKYPAYSNAPSQTERTKAMINLNMNKYLKQHKRFVSVEPILKFNINTFILNLKIINPNYGIAIGYDNYNYKLDEPSFIHTRLLRTGLVNSGYNVIEKTIRKAWWEK